MKIKPFVKLNPRKIRATVEKQDVLIVYDGDTHYWVCDKKYTPRKLRDGRIQFRLAKKL